LRFFTSQSATALLERCGFRVSEMYAKFYGEEIPARLVSLLSESGVVMSGALAAESKMYQMLMVASRVSDQEPDAATCRM
jgi:hypothetical protein